jgi:3-deoxy-7-phosphoheptulonate synthase/chorismate mutase
MSLDELRQQVLDVDREIVDAINRRIAIVQRIWAHKREHGLDKVDPDRERWLHEQLAAANSGPLSAEGLTELYGKILDLTKREVDRS